MLRNQDWLGVPRSGSWETHSKRTEPHPFSRAAGTASDEFPSDTHYHRRDTEGFTDTSLATLTFGFREYGLFGTSTVFNDGSGNTTYYHNTGTAGVSGGSTTGSCQPFHEVRLYAETADTTNLIWSAPLKY